MTILFPSDVMKEQGAKIIDNSLWDVRIIAISTLLLLMTVTFIGVGFESKMQIVLLVVLTASILNYWIGVCIPSTEFKQSRGQAGLNGGAILAALIDSQPNCSR